MPSDWALHGYLYPFMVIEAASTPTSDVQPCLGREIQTHFKHTCRRFKHRAEPSLEFAAMFQCFTAAPISGPSPGTLPYGINPAFFAQYAAALQAQQVRQAARGTVCSRAEWFSRYSSPTLHLPELLPPLRMRCVRTSNACVQCHGMLGHVQPFFSCGVQIGVSFVVGPHERHGEYLRHDIVACYGIV